MHPILSWGARPAPNVEASLGDFPHGHANSTLPAFTCPLAGAMQHRRWHFGLKEHGFGGSSSRQVLGISPERSQPQRYAEIRSAERRESSPSRSISGRRDVSRRPTWSTLASRNRLGRAIWRSTKRRHRLRHPILNSRLLTQNRLSGVGCLRLESAG
jgi:hypothetical protein